MLPNTQFSIVTRTSSKAWIPELIAAAGPEVTETYIDFFTATIRNRNTRQPTRGLAGSFLTGALVMVVAVTPDGQRAVSGSWGGTLRLWDLQTEETRRILKGHTDTVGAVWR